MDEIFRRAALSAQIAWGRQDGFEDLVQDLHVWMLESPAIQKKLKEADRELAVSLARRAALQILAKQALADDTFAGRNNYSADSVREALRGESTNRYLLDILPLALEELGEHNERYAECIRVRYEDGIVPPPQSAEEKALGRAVKSLTEHINLIAYKADVDADGKNTEGPGSRYAIFPSTRRSSHSGPKDPTGDLAIALIEHGDEPIELANGGTTTMRKEFEC